MKKNLHEYFIQHYEHDTSKLFGEIIQCPECECLIKIETITEYYEDEKNNYTISFRCPVCNYPFEKVCKDCGEIIQSALFVCEKCRKIRDILAHIEKIKELLNE